MKNLKIYTMLALMAVVGMAKAQDYQSFFASDSTRVNVYVEMIDFCHTFYVTIRSTDTVNINGTQYVQGFPHGKYGSLYGYLRFYFREEVATGRLYRYFPIYDEEEVLLCDMSLTVGDTFEYYDGWEMRQVTVESVSFDNGRKVIHFPDNYYGHYLVFHEGLFPSFYPIGFIDDFGSDSFLLCEYKDGEQVFENPEFNTCYIDDVSVQEQNLQQVEFFLFPNPAKGNVLIKGIEAAEVRVFNTLGQMVKAVQETNEINMEGFAEGVYLLRITDKEGNGYIKKITKQ
jgi:hypothetical protein